LGGDVPFNEEERQAFVKLAETLNLVPPPGQGTAAKTQNGSGSGPQK
jgi:hypothetical protein